MNTSHNDSWENKSSKFFSGSVFNPEERRGASQQQALRFVAWAPWLPGHVCEGSVGRPPSEAPEGTVRAQAPAAAGRRLPLPAQRSATWCRAVGCGGAGGGQ